MNIKGCLMHQTDDWKTPKVLYDAFIKAGYLDPCPYQCQVDNLKTDYHNKKIYVNPPFSQLDKLVDWSIRQYENGCDVFILMPARTDTKYFHKLVENGPIVYFIKGRLRFNDGKSFAPFPTILVNLLDCKETKFNYNFVTFEEIIDWLTMN